VRRRISDLIQQEGLDEKSALKTDAREFGIAKSEAYRELQRSKALAPLSRNVAE